MRVLDLEATRAALPWADLINAIEAMFAGECVMPLRHHHDVEVPGEANATFLMMPAWVPGRYIGVKVLSVFPDNHLRALPAIFGTYLLSSGKTGEMLMAVEGGELTTHGCDFGTRGQVSGATGCRRAFGGWCRPATQSHSGPCERSALETLPHLGAAP